MTPLLIIDADDHHSAQVATGLTMLVLAVALVAGSVWVGLERAEVERERLAEQARIQALQTRQMELTQPYLRCINQKKDTFPLALDGRHWVFRCEAWKV